MNPWSTPIGLGWGPKRPSGSTSGANKPWNLASLTPRSTGTCDVFPAADSTMPEPKSASSYSPTTSSCVTRPSPRPRMRAQTLLHEEQKAVQSLKPGPNSDKPAEAGCSCALVHGEMTSSATCDIFQGDARKILLQIVAKGGAATDE